MLNKIYVIITSYKEPRATERAVRAFLEQDLSEETKKKMRIIVVDPFPEVEEYINEVFKKEKNVEFFLDPGEGKSYALNILFGNLWDEKGDTDSIIIMSDGDVYVESNAVEKILKEFEDDRVGVVTGKICSLNSRKDKFGYWSHLFFAGINKTRRKLSERGRFFETSGYLFAIRNNIIKEFPLETSEDSVIPYLIWRRGYKIRYTDARVYVLNPSNWRDFLNQKIRNIKSHENLGKMFPNLPRTKSLFNEIKEGFLFSLTFPKNVREFIWTLEVYFVRLYIYFRAFRELKKGKGYRDGWRDVEIKSTRPLD